MKSLSTVSKGSKFLNTAIRTCILTFGCAVAMILPQTSVSQTVTITSLGGTSFCAGSGLTVTYTVSAPFSNVPSANVFSAQVSDAAGSFTGSPVTIGVTTSTTSGSIACTLPGTLTASALYRFRVVSSNPATAGPNNGINITVQVVPASPTFSAVFGNGTWNVYCYNSSNWTNYYGFYTENGSGASGYDFNSTSRWASTTSPSSADASSGLAYSGCSIPNQGNYSAFYKRTNFTCGFYRIDLTHDNHASLLVDGIVVFVSNNVGTDVGVWQGFLGPSTQVEIRHNNTGGPGYIAASIYTIPRFFISPPAVALCTGSSTLSVNFFAGYTYSWSPSTGLSTTTGTVTVASPTVSTTYTCTGTDPVTSCTSWTSVVVTVTTANTTSVSPATVTLNCSIQSSTLIAGGASTYSWSPATGLNTSGGYSVVATPSVSTVYTVSGSDNCSVVTATALVSVLPLVNPTVFPNGTWNVYCYQNSNWTSYYGYYTENGSGSSGYSFNSTSRWLGTPSIANASSGLAYAGCSITNGSSYSTSHKRSNFTCGYYRIDLTHDDYAGLLINGVQVFANAAATASDNGVWQGFLGPTSQVELRHNNSGGGPGLLGATIYTVAAPSISPPVSICPGTSTSLTANMGSGYTYSWSPSTALSTTSGTVTVASPTVSTVYTCTVNDPTTSCTLMSSTAVSVGLIFTTTVSPTTVTVGCAAQAATLVASGAASYTWSPASGLNTTTGFSVVAIPTVSTVYTVSGSNNCTVATATASVVLPINPTVFPTGTWNAYCYNSTNWTNYMGYYTENGSGASGYDFATDTRWSSVAAPTATSASNGNAYVGCSMPVDNWTMSFKRTGFTCNTYTVRAVKNDDDMLMYVNGVLVAARPYNASAESLWSGVLSPSTTVEFLLRDYTTNGYLIVQFIPATVSPTLAVWGGASSNDWFSASNWCGSTVPSSSVNVLINSSGAVFQPTVGASGAACRNLTISAGVSPTVVAGTTLQALPNASLSLGAFNLSVFGDWINYGNFSGPSSTVALVGTGSRTLLSTGTQTFGTLVLNGSGTVAVPSGTQVISNSMNLSNGVLRLNGGALQFLSGATAVNSNTTSYVDGQITKFGNQAFTFPVGGGGNYRPISITAPALSTDNFTARYFYADPSPSYTHTSKDASIDHISRCEYWILDRTGGASSVSVTLSWDPSSCGVSYLPDLLVSRWDAGLAQWKDMGNGATTGNTTAGTVTSGSLVTSFSPFTLGSASVLNVLPVQLLSLEATCTKQEVTVRWVTASEDKNSTFTLERSADGVDFSQVTSVRGSGTSGIKREYTFSDTPPSQGLYYYRLMQTDYNLVTHHLMTTAANCATVDNGITLFPNPTHQGFRLLGLKGQADVNVTDMFGRTVVRQTVHEASPEISLEGQANGVYQVRVKTDYAVTLLKVVKN